MGAILENLHNVITVADRPIRIYVGTESYSDDDEKLKMEIESRISVWRPFAF